MRLVRLIGKIPWVYLCHAGDLKLCIEALSEKVRSVFYFILFIFLIEVQLIYNVVLVSGIQQSYSVIHIYSFSLWFIIGY